MYPQYRFVRMCRVILGLGRFSLWICLGFLGGIGDVLWSFGVEV